MSITELADRVGVARPTISKLESREKNWGVTLAQLDKVARATAGRIIRRTRAQMAVDAQSDGLQSSEDAVEELARELTDPRLAPGLLVMSGLAGYPEGDAADGG